MKKLLLSLVLSSSMLHFSAALALETNYDEGSQVAPVSFTTQEIITYPKKLMGTPSEVFEAAKNPSEGLLKHYKYWLHDTFADFDGTVYGRDKIYSEMLILKSPEENTESGETYYNVSSSEDASAPLSEENLTLLMYYYTDAFVFFKKIPGPSGKRKAVLTVRKGTEHECSINLFLSVVTLQP